jgi:RNA polymerase sigma factor (TIGR02999 family)
MTSPASTNVTELLINWRAGDQTALDKLMPLVYAEMRRLANHYMRRERAGHTLQTSALVNEAYLRLVDHKDMQWQNRAHFFAVAAQAMRRILVDHARGRGYLKRGGDAQQVSLGHAVIVPQKPQVETDIVALDNALDKMAEFDARKSRIIELRYFGGLSVEETAEVMELSPVTIKRVWSAARAWLRREISRK